MAPDTPLDAPVVAVTLHRNGALVRRRGETTARQLCLLDLPLLYAADSVRLRPDRGRVAELTELCRLSAQTRPPVPDAQARTALQLAAQALEDEDRTISAQIQLLEKVVPVPPPPGPRARLPDPGVFHALSSFVRERLTELDAARARLQIRRRELARERALVDRRTRPEPTPPRFFRGLRFTLADAGEGPVAVEVEYFVEAARWVPAWRLELTGSQGRLHLEAHVAQATGEDWTGARLSFSTADLRRETTLPELHSWRLGPAQPPGRPAFRPLPPGLDLLFAGYDRAQRPSVPTPGLPAGGFGGTLAASAPTGFVQAKAEREEESSYPPEQLDDDLRLRVDTAVSAPPPPPPARMRSMAAPSSVAAPAPARPAPGAPPMEALAKRRSGAMPPPAPMMAKDMGEGAWDDESSGALDTGGGGEAELPPRLRYPWLRLAGPDEGGRGTLQPMDPFTQLWSLVEEREMVAPDQLRRAIDALRGAGNAVRQGPVPAGTQELPETHFPVLFAGQTPHDVPGDGQFHRVRVTEEQAEARTEFRTVPRESPDVWRYCLLSVRQDVPRPAGPLAVYRDGAFLVMSALVPGAGGGAAGDEPLALNLGVEPDLRVVHRGVHTQSEDKGLVGQSTRVDHKIALRMRSSLAGEAQVVVYDRLPVPADDRQRKDIEVALLESRPSPTRTDRGPEGEGLSGGLQWALALPPGESTPLEYTYRVTLPARFELEGGNRRE